MVWGIGWPDVVADRAVIRDDPAALLAYREAMLGKEGGDKRSQSAITGNNIPGVERQDRGTSRAYSIAVVQRECDAETVAAVMAGKVSPNAALVRAGVRENRQCYIPRDPAEAVRKLRKQFGDEFLAAIVAVVGGGR